MVFFCCDGCGETLKKSKVDVHAARCYKCVSVSCVDCNVSFYGDDYRQHTSCVSEAQRYEGGTYKEPQKASKQSPQEAWMHVVRLAAESPQTPLAQRQALQQMATLDNVPRKEKAFRNFASNSMGRPNPNMVDQLWKLLASTRDDLKRQDEEAKQQETKKDQSSSKVPDTAHNGNHNDREAAKSREGSDAPTKEMQQNKDEEKDEEQIKQTNETRTNEENGAKTKKENMEEKQPSKKRRRKEEDEADEKTPERKKKTSLVSQDGSTVNKKEQKKAVRKAMKQILRKAPSRQMKFKLLHKKIQRKCSSEVGSKLLRKMVEKSPFQCEDDICALLVSEKKKQKEEK